MFGPKPLDALRELLSELVKESSGDTAESLNKWLDEGLDRLIAEEKAQAWRMGRILEHTRLCEEGVCYCDNPFGEMPPPRVIISISPDYFNSDRVLAVLEQAFFYLGANPRTTLVLNEVPLGLMGDAVEHWSSMGWPLENHATPHVDEDLTYKQSLHMVNLGADLCLSFIADRRLRSDARVLSDLAEARGVEIWEYKT